MAAAVGVPDAIIAKAPSADLWPGQTDESEAGFSYPELDKLLFWLVDKRRSPEELVTKGFAPSGSTGRPGRSPRPSSSARSRRSPSSVRGRPGSTTSTRAGDRARPSRDRGRVGSSASRDRAGRRAAVRRRDPDRQPRRRHRPGARDAPGGPAHRRRGHPDQPPAAGALRHRDPPRQLPRPERRATAPGAARPPSRAAPTWPSSPTRGRRVSATPARSSCGRGRARVGSSSRCPARRPCWRPSPPRAWPVRAGRSRASCRGAGATGRTAWPGSPPTRGAASYTRRRVGSPRPWRTSPRPVAPGDRRPSAGSSRRSTRRSSAATLGELAERARSGGLTLRGEFALVVGEGAMIAPGAELAAVDALSAARSEVERTVASGVARGEAARRVAAATGIPRRQLYGDRLERD